MGIEDRVERVLKKLKLNKFYPFPFARSGYMQTIYGSYWPILKPSKPDLFHKVTLPDGDVLVVAENRPKHWKPGGRVMLLVHGLTGCYQSTYMQRMCRRLYKKGYLVLRLNLRFCGPGKGLARKPYHCGVSEDTRFILEWVKAEFPNSPVTQIGFSLGGNVTLKMAGEDGSRPSGNLDSIVAVSAPLDIRLAVERFGLPENRVFEWFFLKHLKSDLALMQKQFPDMPKFEFPKEFSIRKFDEMFTVPTNGFKDVDHYYRDASSINYVPEIKIPTLILSALDDPMTDASVLYKTPTPNNVDVILTEKGGHVGFLGWGTKYDEVRWSDQAVARWLEDTMAI